MKTLVNEFVKRASLSLWLVFLNILSFGATYYIAPSGNDSNAGTITSPWFTLNKAWTVLKAGDTVYLRGGTYAFNSQQVLKGKNGVSGNPINIFAYPNETPILTKSGSYSQVDGKGIFFSGNYFYWKGLDISGYVQINPGAVNYAMRVENSSYNTFELFKVHGNGGGIHIVTLGTSITCNGNLVLNSDFYENQDPLTTGDPYGNADGLSIAWITRPEDTNTVRGCRFWWNSDDGIDLFANDGTVIIENCQSFYNGYIPQTFTRAGDGNGFKLGNGVTDQSRIVKRIVKNCISVKDRLNGFTPNNLLGIIQMYNCTAYLDGNIGIYLDWSNVANVAINCIAYANKINAAPSLTGIYTTNSWQNGNTAIGADFGISVTNADFVSLDLSLLRTARLSNGDLPVTNFLKLASTSQLIDAGTDVGIPYNGSAPDLGSYESSSAPALPVVYNLTGGGSYCTGGSGVAIGLSNSQTGTNYQLQLNAVNTGTPLAGTGTALSFGNKTTAGTYTVVATNVSTSASAAMSGSAVITVNPLPSVTFTGGVSSAIAGATGNVYTTQSGMSNYQWTVSAGGTITSAGGTANNSVTVTWNTAGSQNVSVNYSNSNGCTALAAANYPVTVSALPIVYNLTGGGSYCTGGSGVAIGLSNSQTGTNYQLQLNAVNTGTPLAGTGTALSFGNKTTAGTYTVVATNVSTSASAAMSGSALITVNPLPSVTFTDGVSSAIAGATGNVYTTQSGMSNCQWTVSAGGTITSAGGTANNSVTVTWNTAGSENVSVNYSNSNGCTASAAVNYPVTVSAPINISFGATYYIAPGGSDKNAGTKTSPWFTLNKAWTVLKAGDTVYLRGGTYAFNSQQYLSGKNGTATNPISILAFPNEKPILTKSKSYTQVDGKGIHFCGDYFYWKGIEIRGFTQKTTAQANGFRVENSSYNTFENLKIYRNGNGFQLANLGYVLHSTGNLILNCDFYENQDPLTAGNPYGSAAGLSIQWITHPEDINTVRGCRFWWNTDDGLNLYHNDGTVVIENCQSFYNGYIPGTFTQGGDGNGFKLGDGIINQSTVIKRIVNNCIAISNRTNGFLDNGVLAKIQMYNCTAYKNGWVGIRLAYNNLPSIVKNSISYSNINRDYEVIAGGDYITNSWQNGIIVTNADFLSLDLSLLLTTRQSNGDLPVTNFLKLASTSKLVDAGTKVGIPFNGNAPDLGSYESSSAVLNKNGAIENEVRPNVINGELKDAPNGSVPVSIHSLTAATSILSDEVRINVFPNPSIGSFTVQFSELPVSGSRIDILDLSGRVLSSRLVTDIREEFNLNNKASGMYLVKTVVGPSQILHKLIINK